MVKSEFETLPSDLLINMLEESYYVMKRCDEIKGKIEKRHPKSFLKNKKYQKVASRKLEIEEEYITIKGIVLKRCGDE